MGNLLNIDTPVDTSIDTSIEGKTYDLSGKTSRLLCDFCIKNKIANIKVFSTYCIVNTLLVPSTPYKTTLGMFYFDKYPSAMDLLVQLMEYKALRGKIVKNTWVYN
jgi:hypothetical protein